MILTQSIASTRACKCLSERAHNGLDFKYCRKVPFSLPGLVIITEQFAIWWWRRRGEMRGPEEGTQSKADSYSALGKNYADVFTAPVTTWAVSSSTAATAVGSVGIACENKSWRLEIRQPAGRTLQPLEGASGPPTCCTTRRNVCLLLSDNVHRVHVLEYRRLANGHGRTRQG